MELQELEKAIEKLPKNDFREFSSWFDHFRANLWDKQIEEDAMAGRLDHLAEKALKEYKEGKFTEL